MSLRALSHVEAGRQPLLKHELGQHPLGELRQDGAAVQVTALLIFRAGPGLLAWPRRHPVLLAVHQQPHKPRHALRLLGELGRREQLGDHGVRQPRALRLEQRREGRVSQQLLPRRVPQRHALALIHGHPQRVQRLQLGVAHEGLDVVQPLGVLPAQHGFALGNLGVRLLRQGLQLVRQLGLLGAQPRVLGPPPHVHEHGGREDQR
mmetsp:Transcript_8172/g.20661  ORF Transcript_8172/g.20661 Transcript_8172/m.20661 type:complete len:206 (-) Transcript_8172:99-716(-)